MVTIEAGMEAELQDLSNTEIAAKLDTPQSFHRLENMLGDDILPVLHEYKKKDFALGPLITDAQIEEYFPAIKASVDSLLGVEVTAPKIRINTWSNPEYLKELAAMGLGVGGVLGYAITALISWDPTPSGGSLMIGESVAVAASTGLAMLSTTSSYVEAKDLINLKRTSQALARGHMAHEYVHAVQAGIGLPINGKLGFLVEGMSEGARYQVGNEADVRYGDLMYKSHLLGKAYRTMASHLGKNAHKELQDNTLTSVGGSNISKYALGTAFMILEQDSKGPGIYRDLTHRIMSTRDRLQADPSIIS